MALHVLDFYVWMISFGLIVDCVTVRIKPSKSVLTLLRDEKENLTCEVTETVQEQKSPLSFTWSLNNGSGIADVAQYAVSGAYPLGRKSVGNFTCTVTASDGTVKGNASIRVESHHPMTNFTGEKRVRLGTHSDICLNVNSYPPPYLFEWRKLGGEGEKREGEGKGGGKREGKGKGEEWRDSGKTMSCPRFLPYTQLSDGGQYEIKVYNNMTDRKGRGSVGVGVANITIRILFPPNVTCQEELTVEVNQPIVINCDVTASPSPRTIMWYRNSTSSAQNSSLETVSQLGNSRWIIVLQTVPQLGDFEEPNYTLSYKIEQVKMPDGGFYLCESKNVLKDYTGRSYNETGRCLTRLIVTEPAIEILAAYMVYLMAGGAAILFLAISIIIGHCVCRGRGKQVTVTPPSKDYLREADKLRTGCRTVANSYTDTVHTRNNPTQSFNIDVQQRQDDPEFVDVNLYSWGNDFDNVDSCSLNVKRSEEDIYQNTGC